MTKVANYWSRHLQAIDREGISAAAYARREGFMDYNVKQGQNCPTFCPHPRMTLAEK